MNDAGNNDFMRDLYGKPKSGIFKRAGDYFMGTLSIKDGSMFSNRTFNAVGAFVEWLSDGKRRNAVAIPTLEFRKALSTIVDIAGEDGGHTKIDAAEPIDRKKMVEIAEGCKSSKAFVVGVKNADVLIMGDVETYPHIAVLESMILTGHMPLRSGGSPSSIRNAFFVLESDADGSEISLSRIGGKVAP